MTQEKRCSELVQDMFDRTDKDWKVAQEYFDIEEYKRPINEEFAPFDSLFDYVNQNCLSWEFVERDTFNDQTRPYYRLQMSWGGPSDEFRIYVDSEITSPYLSINNIEYLYMDWFDGASVEVPIDSVCYDVCSYFLEGESPRSPVDYLSIEQYNEHLEEGYYV